MRENDPQELAELAEPLRSRVAELLRRAAGAVWINSGRRSTEQQVQLRRQHCGTTFYDIYQKPASQCSPPTAIPGRSEHEKGLAVDIGGNKSLAAKLAKTLGLRFPVKGEDWHIEVDPAVPVVAGLTGGILPDDWPVNVDVFPGNLPGVPDSFPSLGDITDAVQNALADAFGAITEPLLEGAGRIALVGVLLAGGVGLVVLGGVRGAQPLKEAV